MPRPRPRTSPAWTGGAEETERIGRGPRSTLPLASVSDQADPTNPGPRPESGGTFPSLPTHRGNVWPESKKGNPPSSSRRRRSVSGRGCCHVKMTDDELLCAISVAVNFLVSVRNASWQNAGPCAPEHRGQAPAPSEARRSKRCCCHPRQPQQ